MALTLALLTVIAAKAPYSFDATFVEGCSCKDVCVTEITGKDAGCHGIGLMEFRKGTYAGKDFSGAKVGWAWDSGKWVQIYIDAPAAKRAAAEAFMKAALADWGALELIKPAKITIKKEKAGFYGLIDDGAIAKIRVQPVFGGDGKTAVTHTNLTSPFHSTLMQGETLSAAFPPHGFELVKTNGFFNASDKMKGKL